MADSYTASGSRASRALIQRLNLPPINLKNLDNTFVLLRAARAIRLRSRILLISSDPTPDAILVSDVVLAEDPLHRFFLARNHDPIDHRKENRRRHQHRDRSEENRQPEQRSREAEVHGISCPGERRLLDKLGRLAPRFPGGLARLENRGRERRHSRA